MLQLINPGGLALDYSEIITTPLSFPQRATEAEEADVVATLGQTVDLSRSFVEIVTEGYGDRPNEWYAYIEAVLTSTQLIWKRRSRSYSAATNNVSYTAVVRQLKTRPKSLQVMTTSGASTLPQQVNYNKSLCFRGCSAPNTYTPWVNKTYLASGTQLVIGQAYHPRATVVEFY
jgi:hypothetical protein